MTQARYTVVIGGQIFEVALARLQGSQLRALAGIPREHTIVVEGRGNEPDQVVADDDWITLEVGPVHVFSIPPTAFG